jgi:hypothetical protein
MLMRKEVNLATGEVLIIPLTAEEIADAEARTAAEAAARVPLPTSDETAAARAALDALVAAGIISAEARSQMSPPPAGT